MKKKVLKKIIVALCAAAMSVPTAASVGAVDDGPADANNAANHQQLNPNLKQSRVTLALDQIELFCSNINQKTLDHGYALDNEAIETSESLQQLKNALNNINNVDLEAMGIGFEDATNYALKDFYRYMINYGNWGHLDKEKLNKIKEKSDIIQKILRGQNVDFDDYI